MNIVRGLLNIYRMNGLVTVSHWLHQLNRVKLISSIFPSSLLSLLPYPLHLVTLVHLTGSELTGNLMVLSLWVAQLEAGKAGISAGGEWALLEEWLLCATSGPPANQAQSPSFPVLREIRYCLINADFFSFLNI